MEPIEYVLIIGIALFLLPYIYRLIKEFAGHRDEGLEDKGTKYKPGKEDGIQLDVSHKYRSSQPR